MMNQVPAAQVEAQEQINAYYEQVVASLPAGRDRATDLACKIFAQIAIATLLLTAITFTAVYFSPVLVASLGFGTNALRAAIYAASVVFGSSVVLGFAAGLYRYGTSYSPPQLITNPLTALKITKPEPRASTPSSNALAGHTYRLPGNCTVHDSTGGAVFVNHSSIKISDDVPERTMGYFLKVHHHEFGNCDVLGPFGGLSIGLQEGLEITLSRHPDENEVYICKVVDTQSNQTTTYYIDTTHTYRGCLIFNRGENWMNPRMYDDANFSKAFHKYPCCPKNSPLNQIDAVSIGSVFSFTDATTLYYNRIGIFVTNGSDQKRAFVSWQGEVLAEGDDATRMANSYILENGPVAKHGEPVYKLDASAIKDVRSTLYSNICDAQTTQTVWPRELSDLIASYLVDFPKGPKG